MAVHLEENVPELATFHSVETASAGTFLGWDSADLARIRKSTEVVTRENEEAGIHWNSRYIFAEYSVMNLPVTYQKVNSIK